MSSKSRTAFLSCAVLRTARLYFEQRNQGSSGFKGGTWQRGCLGWRGGRGDARRRRKRQLESQRGASVRSTSSLAKSCSLLSSKKKRNRKIVSSVTHGSAAAADRRSPFSEVFPSLPNFVACVCVCVCVCCDSVQKESAFCCSLFTLTKWGFSMQKKYNRISVKSSAMIVS